MRSSLRRWSLYALAWLCLAIAALSIIIPVLPTTVPLVVGLVILSNEYAWAHRWLQKFKDRFPKAGGVVLRVEKWIHGGDISEGDI